MSESTKSLENSSAASRCFPDSSYDSFISEYLNHVPSTPYGEAAPIELVITSIEGDDTPVPAKISPLHAWCYHVTWGGIKVSAAGTGFAFLDDTGNRRGGWGGKFAPETLARLHQIIESLPEDARRLPARGHRVVVQSYGTVPVNARVYDRAHLPDVILEMIRITDARVSIPIRSFQPTRQWNIDDPREVVSSSSGVVKAFGLAPSETFELGKTFAESSDGNLIAICEQVYNGHRIRVYSGGIAKPSLELILPQYGRHAIIPVFIGFSPDNKLFLIETDAPETRLFDTRTWKQVTDAPQLNTRAVKYIPSQGWTRAVTVDDKEKVNLWDAVAGRVISSLDFGNEIQSVSFSPNGGLFAVSSGPGEGRPAKLSLWDSNSGRPLRELWPIQWRAKVQGTPLWWDRGRLLVAPIRGQFSPSGVGVWDDSTGRLQGTLAGCGSGNILVEGERLFQSCPEGKVLEWNPEEVRKSINAPDETRVD